VIAEIKKSGALPVLVWLFAFPVVIVAVVLAERAAQNSAITRAVDTGEQGAVDVRWMLTPRTSYGYRNKYQRVVCVVAGQRRMIVHLGKVRRKSGDVLRHWTATSVGLSSASPYRGRC